jgi:hypothetical protein
MKHISKSESTSDSLDQASRTLPEDNKAAPPLLLFKEPSHDSSGNGLETSVTRSVSSRISVDNDAQFGVMSSIAGDSTSDFDFSGVSKLLLRAVAQFAF